MMKLINKKILKNCVIYHFHDEEALEEFKKKRVEPDFKNFIDTNLGKPFCDKNKK